MKVLIDENLKGKELFKYLIENKTQLINEKKSVLKYTDAFSFKSFINTKDAANKADTGIAADATQVRVKVVANTALWCDSQMDVLLPDAAKRSIKERKNLIPHLHDHNHSVEAKIGEVANIYLEDMTLKDLSINKPGSTQVIIFETDVIKSYNDKVFNQYKLGKINQHSIGLQYVKIELAVNDEEYEKELDFWNKYIDKVINKELVEERGFFWVVSEFKLLENSCVLFGSNEITPTLDVKHSGPDTVEPSLAPIVEMFDVSKAIKETRFIKSIF